MEECENETKREREWEKDRNREIDGKQKNTRKNIVPVLWFCRIAGRFAMLRDECCQCGRRGVSVWWAVDLKYGIVGTFGYGSRWCNFGVRLYEVLSKSNWQCRMLMLTYNDNFWSLLLDAEEQELNCNNCTELYERVTTTCMTSAWANFEPYQK